MNLLDNLPDDFREAVRFHGHLCPGLAIGYVAAKVAAQVLGIGTSEDEEIVALVENNSCAVDAIQVLLVFWEGNLISRIEEFLPYGPGDYAVGVVLRYAERDERRALKWLVRQSHGRGKGKVGEVEAERNQADSLGRSPRLLPDPGSSGRTAPTCGSG
jgi:hypothetical protein